MTEENKAKCVEWTKAHAKHWQTYKRAQWKYKWHGKTLVRFLDNVSMRELQDGLLLEYLCSPDCMETLSLYSQDVSKEWTPISAWYEIMATRGPVNGILQVRLYHALRTDVENGGDGPYVVENGCMWNVSWQFFWHQTSVPALPKSSSGVNYRISNLNRDDEDGTYSYVLERRERVQQDIPEYVREVDAFKTQSREEHKGVKGETTKGGKPASVKQGVIVTRDVSKNEDCTHDTSNTTVVSNEVNGAVTETTVGLHGGSTVTVNRNMRNKANEDGLQPGESVRNELNEDLTWNQTIRSWKRDFIQWLRGVCRKTIYRHTHAVTTATGTDPGFDHVSIPTEDPGKVHEIDVQRTETGFDVTDTVNEDLPVSDATVEKRVFLDGVTKTTVNRNQSAPAKDFDIGIGGSVRNEKTESGLYDQTIVEASAEDVGKTGEHCEQTHLVHTHGQTDVLGSKNVPKSVEATAEAGQTASIRMERTERGGYRVVKEIRKANEAHAESRGGTISRTVSTDSFRNTDSIPSGEPSVNEEIDVSASVNEFGKYDGTTRKTKYSPETTTSVSSNPLFSETTTVVTNDTDVNPSEVAEDGEYVTVSSSPTGRGSANKTITRRTAKPADAKATTTSESRTVEMTSFRNRDGEVSESAGVNEEIDVSVSVNEFGRKDGTVRKTKYRERSVFDGDIVNSDYKDVSLKIVENAVKPDVETADKNEDVQVSMSGNDHGSVNYQVRKTTYKERPVFDDYVMTSDKKDIHLKIVENAESPSVTGATSNEDVQVSASGNDHGSVNYQVRRTTYKKSEIFNGNIAKSDAKDVNLKIVENDTNLEVDPAGDNEDVYVSASGNEHGSLNYQVRRTKYKEREAKAVSGNAFYDEESTDVSHTTDPNGSFPYSEGTVYQVSSSKNMEGSYDKRIVKRTAKPRKWDVEVSIEMAYHKTQYFMNATEEEYKQYVKSAQDIVAEKVKGWNDAGRPPANFEVKPNINMNEFGLFDGSVRMDVTWAAGSAGQTGDINKVTIEKRVELYRGDTKTLDMYIGQGRGIEELKNAIEKYTQYHGSARSCHLSFSYNENTCGWNITSRINSANA